MEQEESVSLATTPSTARSSVVPFDGRSLVARYADGPSLLPLLHYGEGHMTLDIGWVAPIFGAAAAVLFFAVMYVLYVVWRGRRRDRRTRNEDGKVED